ncbi:hypothetical protein BD780_003745 [Clostridium tetanomorphum]|uniref:PadR family transcriptional regulator n=1 Tax=Clostridium tetanomorphum TaxID=1553 RepID=A0A923J3G1_CLOTT|nr:PadR family transcriptional regulator [Clostridium tetanomorphum]KAJ50557.1 transcriptional regulator [Clostridium tetanomorphum DSM 665]MBC2400135.1 PadR family transcriptional regulator [Clostridium tetanomorphum]MBP1866523.1 hypothetical protein [Clostridium tetanomorphum]NRS86520.1 hypothetical protein [Clostridium tetanomorphum]NRZ95451.1 hypothetical protein [Clostridium tetanomorphum]
MGNGIKKPDKLIEINNHKIHIYGEGISNNTPTVVFTSGWKIPSHYVDYYPLQKELQKKSQNTFLLKEGTLYPISHSLEKQEFVVTYMSEGDKGRTCKYYKITDYGKRQLEEKKKEWINFSYYLNKVIEVDGNV